MSNSDVVSQNKFSTDYALSEILKFRELMGTKMFWEDPVRASRALRGLLYVYGNSEDPTALEIHILSATDEYDRRLAYMLMREV